MFLLFLLICLSGCAQREVARQSPPEPEQSYDIFLVIDQSGSMLKTDPQGLRLRAAEYFVRYLTSFSRRDSHNRIGLVNFGTEAPDDLQVSLTPIQDAKGMTALRAHLRNYARPDWQTSFIQAFQKVKALYRNTDPHRQPVIVLFTDGEPDDARRVTNTWTITQYFQELEAYANRELFRVLGDKEALQLTSFRLFVIGFDTTDQFWSRDDPSWKRIAQGGTFRLASADQEVMNEVYGRIAESLIATVPGEWDDLIDGEKMIQVPPYTEKVSVSLLRKPGDPRIPLGIRDPSGTPVSLDDTTSVEMYQGEGFDIYTLLNPTVGVYTLKLTRRGKVRVKADVLPITFRLLTPSTEHAQGEPVRVRASFLRQNGSPVTPLPQYPLRFEATIEIPDSTGKPGSLYRTFKDDPGFPGHYLIPEVFETRSTGTCRITAFVKMLTVDQAFKGKEILFTKTTEVTVEPFVHFRPLSPAPQSVVWLYNLLLPWRMNPLVVRGALYRNTRIERFEDHFMGNPESAVLCQIEDEHGQIVNTPALVSLLPDPKDPRVFVGTIQGLTRSGRYTLRCAVKASRKDGRDYAFLSRSEFAVGRPLPLVDKGAASLARSSIGGFLLLVYGYIVLRVGSFVLLRVFRGRLQGSLLIETHTVVLTNFGLYNKLKFYDVKGWHCPWLFRRRVSLRAPAGDPAKGKRCPTFWAIGGKGDRIPNTRRRDAAVWLFSVRQFPFWKKLTKRNSTVRLGDVTIRWQPLA